jgi:hypothetical protein
LLRVQFGQCPQGGPQLVIIEIQLRRGEGGSRSIQVGNPDCSAASWAIGNGSGLGLGNSQKLLTVGTAKFDGHGRRIPQTMEIYFQNGDGNIESTWGSGCVDHTDTADSVRLYRRILPIF